MNERDPLHLFEAVGIELEYMIVDGETLSVRPIADELLREVGGGYDIEVELGSVAWSNELALHVIELKTNGPSATLHDLGATFHDHVARINAILEPMDARLLPTAMHPWMDPNTELELWPHENQSIYETFNRIFSCKGHGWANLQSTHINLPFAGDAEFGRLHAATRLVLPLLPGLAASSPARDGVRGDWLDTRLEMYRHNARRVPSVTGHVIPEPAFTQRDYESLLRSVYDDLAPLDPDGVIRHEWVNARGCIARFDRMSIEIRILDIQECPRADIAVAAAVIEVVRALTQNAWCSDDQQQRWDERELAAILLDSIRDADMTIIDNRSFLEAFGYPERGKARLRDVWQHLIETTVRNKPGYDQWQEPLELVMQQGCLARRIVTEVRDDWSRGHLRDIYGRLADCLAEDTLFRAAT